MGSDALAASVGEERGTIEDVVEPYLMQIGFLARTPRGRQLTPSGWEHLGMTAPGGAPAAQPGSSSGRRLES